MPHRLWVGWAAVASRLLVSELRRGGGLPFALRPSPLNAGRMGLESCFAVPGILDPHAVSL